MGISGPPPCHAAPGPAVQSRSLHSHRQGTSEGLSWPLSQRRRVPGAWPACQGISGEGPQAETHPAVCLLTYRLVGTRAVWRVHLVNAGCAKGGGTATLPSEPTAWWVRQTGPRRLPSDAASVRTEVGTQPCHSGVWKCPICLSAPGKGRKGLWHWDVWEKPRPSKGRPQGGTEAAKGT